MLATVCGLPPHVAGDMPFPDYLRLARYWRRQPPVHLMVAAYLGVKAPRETGAKPQFDFGALMRANKNAPGGFIRADQLGQLQ
jgi:hypothetical protein